MTATLPDLTSRKKPATSPELDAAKELVRLANAQGLALTGPDGLLNALTKTALETALLRSMCTTVVSIHSGWRRRRGRA
jgi:putative transposase